MRNDAERMAVYWGIPLGIALLAIAVRLLFSAKRLTWVGVARSVTVGIFVGAMVNLYLGSDSAMSDGTRGSVVGVSVVLAEDLMVALLALGRQIREKPETLLSVFFRGKG